MVEPVRPEPDAPVPDTKDWTWVVERTCGQCGHDVRTFDRDDLADLVRRSGSAWLTVLARDGEALRARPEPAVWSPIEYAAHVRDVFALYDERLRLMLTQDGPSYPNWDQDDTAIADAYHLAEAADVAAGLDAAATSLADRFATVHGETWDRTGYRSDGAAFTVESFGRYFLHDIVHHLWDVDAEFSI